MDSENAPGTDTTLPDQDGLAAALGAIPSGLFVVTVGVGDAATGFLASFVQQIGFEPPTVTVAVRSEVIAHSIREVGGFCINVLGADDRDHLVRFAKGPPPAGEAFDDLEARPGPDLGIPVLTATEAQLECRLVGEAAQWTDHVVFCGRVVTGRRKDAQAKNSAVHLRRNGLGY